MLEYCNSLWEIFVLQIFVQVDENMTELAIALSVNRCIIVRGFPKYSALVEGNHTIQLKPLHFRILSRHLGMMWPGINDTTWPDEKTTWPGSIQLDTTWKNATLSETVSTRLPVIISEKGFPGDTLVSQIYYFVWILQKITDQQKNFT